MPFINGIWVDDSPSIVREVKKVDKNNVSITFFKTNIYNKKFKIVYSVDILNPYIDIYKNKGDFTWGDVWSDIQAVNSKSEYKKITKSFFTITPTVNIDIPLNRFIAFRLGAGYQTDLSGEWKIDNEQTLFNVPSKLNANAFYVQTGLFFGFFAF